MKSFVLSREAANRPAVTPEELKRDATQVGKSVDIIVSHEIHKWEK